MVSRFMVLFFGCSQPFLLRCLVPLALMPALLSPIGLMAQQPTSAVNRLVVPVEDGALPSIWQDLLRPAGEWMDDPAAEERLIDLVQAQTVDSIYDRKTERHQFVGAAMFRVFGIRWVSVRQTREQIVGQVQSQHITRKEHFTEYDVNFDIVPHLPRSLDVVYAGYMAQAALFKARKKVTPGEPPYIPPGEASSTEAYEIHVECTPLRELRDTLDAVFYPTLHPHSLADHPNVGRAKPVFGVYGPLVSDCNHSCWPEIHPYDWIWWRHPPSPQGAGARWSIGFLRDASNRMPHWAPNPREGGIRIPVVLDYNNRANLTIRLQTGPGSAFSAEGLSRWPVPADAMAVRGTHTLSFDHPALDGKTLQLASDVPLPLTAAAWWLEDLRYDADRGMLHGMLHLAISTEAAFTGWLQVP